MSVWRKKSLRIFGALEVVGRRKTTRTERSQGEAAISTKNGGCRKGPPCRVLQVRSETQQAEPADEPMRSKILTPSALSENSASTMAAVLNYPLWRASAIGQSGFRVVMSNSTFSSVHPSFQPFVYAFCPPYKGLLATVAGMSWARAAIFFGSDVGREMLLDRGYSNTTSTLVPPLVVSSCVQVVNMPLVRATVMLQNPQSSVQNIRESLKLIYSNHGLPGLWHGTSAGILKTVPKYCSAIFVKELLEEALPPVDPASPTRDKDALIRAAIKSSFAGVAGAILTNPLVSIFNYACLQALLH